MVSMIGQGSTTVAQDTTETTGMMIAAAEGKATEIDLLLDGKTEIMEEGIDATRTVGGEEAVIEATIGTDVEIITETIMI
jgi:hypothetical protein